MAAMITATVVTGAVTTGADRAEAQPPSGSTRIPVIVRWSGPQPPGGINGPAGEAFTKETAQFTGTLPRPTSDVRKHDLEVVYEGREYPLRVRVHPQTERVEITVAMDRPKSCANVYLRPLEKPTLTQVSSVRAALTLSYMIDGRTGENSCDQWPLRAARARFERYQNAMERSSYLVIPEAVKDALRATATTDGERRQVAMVIANGEKVERERLAMVLQNSVLAQLKSGDVTAAFSSSELLLEKSAQPEFASAIASQIDPEVLRKQTADLGIQAGVELPESLATPERDEQ
jgi:hypothetical protein